jgi:hypothetical protein
LGFFGLEFGLFGGGFGFEFGEVFGEFGFLVGGDGEVGGVLF